MTDKAAGESKPGEAGGARDFGGAPPVTDKPTRPPRKYIVGIGIDQYRSWNRLHNAVNDARGALAAFQALGFEEFRPALFDEAATCQALQSLVINELPAIREDDSLVLFFAGHGHTDATPVQQGYLIPVDGASVGGHRTTWVNLKAWLDVVSKLHARHILVILDACHSGIALDATIRWRDNGRAPYQPLTVLRERRSRRILTSAHGDQRALDGGPRPGHSLFTGCLIEGLTGSLPYDPRQTAITGSEIGLYVQKRVDTYPSPQRQTPDFGALELDDRGDLVIDLRPADEVANGGADILGAKKILRSGGPEITNQDQGGADKLGPKHTRSSPPPAHQTTTERTEGDEALGSTTPPLVIATTASASTPAPTTTPTSIAMPAPAPAATPTNNTTASPSLVSQPVAPPLPLEPPISHAAQALDVPPSPVTPTWAPPPAWPVSPPPRGFDLAFVAKLDLHSKARANERVLSVVDADPLLSLTGWATWSAHRGHLTLVSEQTELEAVIADVLGQMPWMRTLPAARALFAAVARCDVQVVSAEIGKRSSAEREAWIEAVVGRDRLPRVAGWLLAAFHETWASGPDLSTAPAKKLELLGFLDALCAPITILLHHHTPTSGWLEQAIHTAAQLTACVPRHAVAIGAPKDLIDQVLRDRSGSSAFALARKGRVQLGVSAPIVASDAQPAPEQRLARALAEHPATANLFLPNVPVNVTDRERPVTVDLWAADALLAIQIDDWYRVPDRQSYHRDRESDRWLQRTGYFVTRFLAEDIEHRLERVVEEIALGVATRRTEPSAENPL